ncbi:MAG: pentapeptide repeat-containing protein [Anaerolineae bacterium]|nr:pentapeptide repeat-containing protein [Anaerolineae bacterium]
MKPTWKKFLLYATYILLASGLLYGLLQLILSGYAVDWTGFQTKTLWDWMDLLVIPFVLALGAFFLNRSERAVERETAKQRDNLERQIAKDRQQEAALQAYIDRMSELLLEKKIQGEDDKDEVLKVARIRTVTILRALNVQRNKLVVDFLRDASLVTDENSIFNDAKIERVDLSGLDLSYIFLKKAVLEGTTFKNSKLSNANLEKADLQECDLTRSNFIHANLQKANLRRTNLRNAFLWFANLQEAVLDEANLQNADLLNAKLQGVNFGNADLRNANFTNADLQSARFYSDFNYSLYLKKQKLPSKLANLAGANLAGANLKGAMVTPEQLAQAKSLKGTIMPDGTVHE